MWEATGELQEDDIMYDELYIKTQKCRYQSLSFGQLVLQSLHLRSVVMVSLENAAIAFHGHGHPLEKAWDYNGLHRKLDDFHGHVLVVLQASHFPWPVEFLDEIPSNAPSLVLLTITQWIGQNGLNATPWKWVHLINQSILIEASYIRVFFPGFVLHVRVSYRSDSTREKTPWDFQKGSKDPMIRKLVKSAYFDIVTTIFIIYKHFSYPDNCCWCEKVEC